MFEELEVRSHLVLVRGLVEGLLLLGGGRRGAVPGLQLPRAQAEEAERAQQVRARQDVEHYLPLLIRVLQQAVLHSNIQTAKTLQV